MAGYTRNDTANNIADGLIINASDLDGEFDAIEAAFDETTGHNHDGTTGGGAVIDFNQLSGTPTIPSGTIVGTTDSQTLTNKTFTGYTETVYALSGTAFGVGNGTIQTKTLSANTTFTDSLSSGQSVLLMLTGADTYTITWPTITWVTAIGNTVPTWTGSDVVLLWKVGTTLYGSFAGSFV